MAMAVEVKPLRIASMKSLRLFPLLVVSALLILLLSAACVPEETGDTGDREDREDQRSGERSSAAPEEPSATGEAGDRDSGIASIFSSTEPSATEEAGDRDSGAASIFSPVAVTPSPGSGDFVSAPPESVSSVPSESVPIPTEMACPRRQPDPNVALPPAVTSAETDREALVALFEATNGESWDHTGTWAGFAPLGQWLGVTTNEEGRVTSLELNQRLLGNRTKDLKGKLPPELGNLSSLQVLSIGLINSQTPLGLTGEIPPELGNLSSLQELSIVTTRLAGGIPPELGSLPSLRSLQLVNNRLTGEIPPELGSLASLESLDLSVNQLCGEIPPELDALAGLRVLNLDYNRLTGEFPLWLEGLPDLKNISLQNNQLTGAVSARLVSYVEQLAAFNVTGNQFEGCRPSFLGFGNSATFGDSFPICTEVQPGEAETLVAIHQALGQPQLRNWLSRQPLHTWEGVAVGFDGRVALLNIDAPGPVEIPPEIGNLTGLKYLRLNLGRGRADDPPNGELPPELGNLTALQTLDIRGNITLEGCSEGANAYQAGILAQLCETPGKFLSLNPHSMLLDNGSPALSWSGEIRDLPTIPPEGKFTSVSGRLAYGCGLKADGSLACWGSNNSGRATPPEGKFTSVSVGDGHACGLRTDGSLACWGNDNHGQATPPEGKFTSVSAGKGHSCGVRTDGSLACWGSNQEDQATPPEGKFTSVSAGLTHGCGVKTDGSLACWGRRPSSNATSSVGKFTSVSAGYLQICGLRDDGSVICWRQAQLYAGTPFSFTPSEGTFTSVSVSAFSSEIDPCGMTTDGYAACWDLTGNMTYYSDRPFGSERPTAFSRVYAKVGVYCATSAAATDEHPQSWCFYTAP